MPRPFQDHFGNVSQHYADSRPNYPSELFDWLTQQCPQHDLALDCGTGSGQAAQGLAPHFLRVVATDASAGQIAQAARIANVEFRQAPAETSGLPCATVDLVTVAQALHWFDLDSFYAETKRILKPDGLIAAWSYGILDIEGESVDACLQHFYHRIVGPYWPAERRHVESGYRELPFPFERLTPPPLHMRTEWNLPQLLGYLRSWSATDRYIQSQGKDPVEAFEQELIPLWGNRQAARQVRWPLVLLCGRNRHAAMSLNIQRCITDTNYAQQGQPQHPLDIEYHIDFR